METQRGFSRNLSHGIFRASYVREKHERIKFVIDHACSHAKTQNRRYSFFATEHAIHLVLGLPKSGEESKPKQQPVDSFGARV